MTFSIDTPLYRVRACKAWYNIAISFYQSDNPERIYILWKVNHEEWKVYPDISNGYFVKYRHRMRKQHGSANTHAYTYTYTYCSPCAAGPYNYQCNI